MIAHEHQGENSHLPSCSPSLTWRLTTNRRALNTSPWWPPRPTAGVSVFWHVKLEAGFGEGQTTRELPSTPPICRRIFETPHLHNQTGEFKLSTAQVPDPFKYSFTKGSSPSLLMWCSLMKKRVLDGNPRHHEPNPWLCAPVPGTLPINSSFSAEVRAGAGIPGSNLITEKVRGGRRKKKLDVT